MSSTTESGPDFDKACRLHAQGRWTEAEQAYLWVLERHPGLATAHYNLALLYKRSRRYAEAVAAYEKAVELGIGNVQEVYSNLGVLYSELRDADRATAMYRCALQADPKYLPAMFNLAGLLEESGDREQGIDLYRRILAIDPRQWASLARLAHAQTVKDSNDPLVAALKHAIEAAQDDRPAREALGFALGKVMDDLGRYEEAFSAYHAANELGRLRNPPYDKASAEQAFVGLIERFSPEWIQGASTGSTARPIFICGMFRSGSTLVEQMLAGHPAVRAGGELDYLPWLAARRLAPYPQRIGQVCRAELELLAEEYLARLRELFPHDEHVSDKRPDNFLHLGLIKALFPSARIVHTKRNLLDNCVSVYFQQLGGQLGYACDLASIAHYYWQQERLMSHWAACFGDNIFTVDYDELVRSPEPVLRGLLDFLGLEWDDRCLDFRRGEGLVKTASVWQVRDALHTRSSGRWRHYQAQLLKVPGLPVPEKQDR